MTPTAANELPAAERLERACGRLIAGGGRVEEILGTDGELAADDEAVLDLIDAEYCRRCDRGEPAVDVAADLRCRFAELAGLDELLAISPQEPPPLPEPSAGPSAEPAISELRTLRVLSPTARLVEIDAPRPRQFYREHQVVDESVADWVSRQRRFRDLGTSLPDSILRPHAVSVDDELVHWLRPWVEGIVIAPDHSGRGGEREGRSRTQWTDAAWLLAALHAAGFYHGGLDGGLILDHDGRPHLVDAMVNAATDPALARRNDWCTFSNLSRLSADQLTEPMAAGVPQ